MKPHSIALIMMLVILVGAVHAQEAEQGYDHEKYIVFGNTKHNFIGCSRGAEVPRVFDDWQGRTITKRASSGALALRECIFVEAGEYVDLIRPGEIVQIGETAVAGYYIRIWGENQPFGPVWYPRSFLDDIKFQYRELPKYEPEEVPDLEGPLPVGRWSIWSDFRPEWIAKSNSGRFNYFEAEWELREDGRGNVLKFHGKKKRPNPGSFSFPSASGFIWTYGDEFAWEWREPETEYTGHLILLTTRAEVYALVNATDDLLIMISMPSQLMREGYVPYSDPEWQRQNGGRDRRTLMVRIGSALDDALVKFKGCVIRNEDRKLYEMEECVDPFVDANGRRIPGIGIALLRIWR